MARDRSPIVKQSRREDYALHPKAHKYMIKRPGGPGQHGTKGSYKRSGSNNQYSLQLREKQKVRRQYGLLEKQFKLLFKEAERLPGQAGANTITLLERRLDNILYRAGFGFSRRAARQLISHKHFKLNDRRVNIASIRVKVGDIIQLRDKSKSSAYFKAIDDLSPKPATIPGWLSVNRKQFKITIKALPNREDIEDQLNEQLIVEYYSR